MSEKLYAIVNKDGWLYGRLGTGWQFLNPDAGSWFSPMLTHSIKWAFAEVRSDTDFDGCQVVTFPDMKPVNLISCKVENGIVSWWRLGEDAPIAARSVTELMEWHRVRSARSRRYFSIDKYGHLGLYSQVSGGSYDSETGEVVQDE